MIKITINSAIACALFLCSGTMAMAGSPYNLTIPALGSQPKPHVAQPALQPKPVISRSVGHTKTKKKSVQKKPGRAHSPVSQGALRPTEPKRRIPGVQVHRRAPAISIKQHLPVGTRGLGKRFGADSHNSVPASRVRSGKTGGGGFAPSHRGGFAPARPLGSNGTTSGGSSPGASHPRGGFAPAGLAGQIHIRNALSPEQLARMSGVQEMWRNYKRAVEEKQRRDAARARERVRAIEAERRLYVDCDDTDPHISPSVSETCDHKDNNCDGHVDEGVTIKVYADVDGDGHGDPAQELDTCQVDINNAPHDLGIFLVPLNNDCDDHDPDHWHDCPAAGSSR